MGHPLLPDPDLARGTERAIETPRQRTERRRKEMFKQIVRTLEAHARVGALDLRDTQDSINRAHDERDNEVLALANLIVDPQ